MEQPPRRAQPTPPALGALAALERDVAVLREAWAGALPAWGAVGGAVQVDVEQMSDPGLMRVTDALAQVRRDVDVVLARVAAEVAKRSGPEFGDAAWRRRRASTIRCDSSPRPPERRVPTRRG